MAVIPWVQRKADEELDDRGLLDLFRRDPRAAWDLFIDRYAKVVLGTLRHLGFDHDDAMDRFVYVCEKLSDDGFRRLREVRFAGRRGELLPWVRQVVVNLSLDWARSVHGRRRLFKSIAALPRLERRVFELFFWHGQTPSGVWESLRAEGFDETSFSEVFDALEKVFAHLDQNQCWRLASRLARHRPAIAVDSPDPVTGFVFEAPAGGPSPEEALLEKELREDVQGALGALAPRQRLILQLRYEEALSLAEIAEVVGVSVSTVKGSLRAGLTSLREAV